MKLSTSIDILLIWIGLSLELFKLSHLKTLPHGPLDDTTITRNGDKEFSLTVSLDPVDFPNDVCVLLIDILGGGDWLRAVRVSHIVDGDVTMRVSNSDQMWLFLRELAACDRVISSDNLLWELRILEGPEAKKTWLEVFIASLSDFWLSISNGDQIWVSDIDIDTRDISTLGLRALEGEKWDEVDLILLILLLLFLLFLILLLLLLLFEAHETSLLLFVIILIVILDLLKENWWEISVKNVLLWILGLSQKTLNNFNGLEHGVW